MKTEWNRKILLLIVIYIFNVIEASFRLTLDRGRSLRLKGEQTMYTFLYNNASQPQLHIGITWKVFFKLPMLGSHHQKLNLSGVGQRYGIKKKKIQKDFNGQSKLFL